MIGRGAALLRKAGTDARLELEALLGVRVHLETHVRVDRDWQRRAVVAGSPRALSRGARGRREFAARDFESQSCDPANRPL